jgi:hypothetical protein
MKTSALRSAMIVSILALLTACGGDIGPDTTPATTAAVKMSVSPQVAASEQPVPDCQPENCAGLRIIDGNAEAFRVDAMRRASQDS